ncbi:hypothetical protein QC764_0011820 [Podospora pseudoanserina]|nr:hypothetical protein QC764_0011820 [Podospora pseudoanserina]
MLPIRSSRRFRSTIQSKTTSSPSAPMRESHPGCLHLATQRTSPSSMAREMGRIPFLVPGAIRMGLNEGRLASSAIASPAATTSLALDLSSHVLLVFLVVVQKDNGVGGLREIASNAGVDPSTKILSK